jgi:hypothetical protein
MTWTCYHQRWQDCRITDDASYRVRHKWISDNLTTLGWTKTADTGQIDLTTATRPGSPTANTSGGYEIRESTGTATKLYLKIYYGLGYNTNCPGWWFHFGTSTDGAGTLTGVVTSLRYAGSALSTISPYEATYLLAGDADNFVFGGVQEQTAANGCLFGVQRSCNSSGTDTNSGWWQYGAGYVASVTAFLQWGSFKYGVASYATNWGVMNVVNAVTGTPGPSQLFLPIWGNDGSAHVPLRDVIGSAWGGNKAVVSIPNFGSSKKYLSIFGTSNNSIWGYTHPTSVYCYMRVS